MKKKLMKVAGILLAVSLITAGCGYKAGSSSDEGKESGGNKKAESVTLTVEASQEIVNNIPYAFSEENIAAFEEQYPEIKVE